MKEFINVFCIVILLNVMTGCFLLTRTVGVTLPDGYQGWCYIVPVRDTTGIVFKKNGAGSYEINKDGVAYVPEYTINKSDDVRIEVYEGGEIITSDVRYLGRVETSNSFDNTRYQYVSFFVPDKKGRAIKSSDTYWREKRYELRGNNRFDSLLLKRKIVFK